MKILITGAAGQLATELSKILHAESINNCGFTRAELDICDIVSVEEILTREQPDWVINTAAYTAVDKAESEPEAAFAVNCMGVENLATVCKALDIPLLQVSTDYVFSGAQQQPYKEDDSCEPINIYGKSKLTGELVLRKIWDKHIILRTAWVYGNFGKNFMKTMLNVAKQRSELTVVADQYGSPTATIDIAAAILTIVQAKIQHWGTYHFSNQGVTTWLDFANAIFLYQNEYLPRPIVKPITTAEYPTPAKRPEYSVLDCAKIQRDYKIVPRSWQQALQTVIEQE